MMSPARTLVALLAVTTMLAASCTGDGDGHDGQVGAEVEQPDAGDDDDGEAPSSERSGSHVQGVVSVGRRLQHASGVTVDIGDIRAEGNGVYVTLEAFNPSDQEVELAIFDGDATYLMIDEALPLRLVPPEGNEQMAVPPAGELSAELAFVGRIPSPDASLALRVNWDETGPYDPDNPYTDSPSFEFADLPVPGGTDG